MVPDDAKLKHLILYISQRCEGDATFGKTKLYKLLFYSDFSTYAAHLQSITGQEYRKWPLGPVPVRAEALIEKMKQDRVLAMAERSHYGRLQLKPVALKEPDLSLFTGLEIAIVDEVVSSHWGRGARDISDLSHDFIGWKAAAPTEVIPYETALVEAPEWADEDLRHAEALVAAGR